MTAPAGGYGLWAGAGVVLIVGAFVGAEVNGAVNGLGFRTTRDGDLVLTRAHPAFAQAVAAASVEPVPR
ncbi:hypothetical protein [Nocardioides rubriscoriae]|uniref:hypothetical protein n=1 Tax=Nocardioides rubriscoriae TaxID=642762 RepID=UPI0011E04BE7|nr:hypothetical protein [Nocardioides rubriscoriae]